MWCFTNTFFYIYTSCTYWKNLNAFTVLPELEKSSLKSSSVTSCLLSWRRKTLQPCCVCSSQWSCVGLVLTGCWRGEGWQRVGRCSGSSWIRVSWIDVEGSWRSPWLDPGRPGRHEAAPPSGAWTVSPGWSCRTSSDHSGGSSLWPWESKVSDEEARFTSQQTHNTMF